MHQKEVPDACQRTRVGATTVKLCCDRASSFLTSSNVAYRSMLARDRDAVNLQLILMDHQLSRKDSNCSCRCGWLDLDFGLVLVGAYATSCSKGAPMVHMMDEYVFESNDDFLLLMPFGKAQRRNAGHCATVRAVTPMRMACAPRVGHPWATVV